MQVGGVSAFNGVASKGMVRLNNISKDMIPNLQQLESISQLHEMDMFISKVADGSTSRVKDKYIVKTKKMLKTAPMHVESTSEFEINKNVTAESFMGRLNAAVKNSMDKMYTAYGNVLRLINMMQSTPEKFKPKTLG